VNKLFNFKKVKQHATYSTYLGSNFFSTRSSTEGNGTASAKNNTKKASDSKKDSGKGKTDTGAAIAKGANPAKSKISTEAKLPALGTAAVNTTAPGVNFINIL
jgi:hypothetical protein